MENNRNEVYSTSCHAECNIVIFNRKINDLVGKKNQNNNENCNIYIYQCAYCKAGVSITAYCLHN